MPKIRVELGSRAYLFKDAAGYAPSVVISAHGYHLPTTPNLLPGFPTLHFYCAHNGTVDDVPQSTAVRNMPPAEIVPYGLVNTTTDYQIYKFGEHKASIERLRSTHNRAHPHNQMTFAEMEDELVALGRETYGTFRNVLDPHNDYVTVRNRHQSKGGPVISLSALIALIQAEHNYATIKCCFCREAKPAGWVPDMNADQ